MPFWGDCVKPINGGDSAQGVASLDCIPVIFSQLVYWAFSFAGIVAVFFIIWGGIKLLNSGGDKTQVAEAKKTLTFAIIGLIIILLSAFMVKIIAYISGAQCITTFGFETCK